MPLTFDTVCCLCFHRPMDTKSSTASADELPTVAFITSDPDRQKLAVRYWHAARDPRRQTVTFPEAVEKIAAESRMTAKQLRDALLSIARATFGECVVCSAPIEVQTRAQCQMVADGRVTTCDACAAEARAAAETASAEMEAIRQVRHAVGMAKFVDETKPREVDCLRISAEHAAYLLAIGELVDDRGVFIPSRETDHSLAPTPEQTESIISSLYDAKLLGVHPSTPEFAIEFDNDGDPTGFEATWVNWVAPPLGGLRRFLGSGRVPFDLERASLYLWRSVCLHECIAYAGSRVLKVMSLQLKRSDHLQDAILDALDSQLSAGQIHRLIWKSVAWVNGRGVTDPSKVGDAIGQSVVFLTRQIVDTDQQRTAESYDNAYIESALSRAVFYELLKIGERGFMDPPRRITNQPTT